MVVTAAQMANRIVPITFTLIEFMEVERDDSSF
jgi:hypothetical protein